MSEIRALAEATCQIDAAMEALQDYTVEDDVHAAWMALNGINILLENRLRGLLASDVFYSDEAVGQRRLDSLARDALAQVDEDAAKPIWWDEMMGREWGEPIDESKMTFPPNRL